MVFQVQGIDMFQLLLRSKRGICHATNKFLGKVSLLRNIGICHFCLLNVNSLLTEMYYCICVWFEHILDKYYVVIEVLAEKLNLNNS